MSDEAKAGKKCLRCGAVVETCAVCDEPDCPAITCFRCTSVAFLDRMKPRSARSSATEA